MSSNTSGLATNLSPADAATEHGRLQFVIRTALSGMRTAVPVQIISVSNSGGVSPIGTVSVQPLVSMVDGGGTVWPHGVIHNVPYMRIQGGANAVIIDPQVGDIGLGVVCDRDISSVQNTRGPAAPSSARKYDLSDMVYVSTILSAQAPTQYIQFNSSGITITSPQAVTINANTANINATTSAEVSAPVVSVTATTSASVVSPSISLGPSGGTLQAIVNASVAAIYNSHTHISASPGSATSVPSNTIGAGQLTTAVKAT